MRNRTTAVIVSVALLFPLMVSSGCQTPQRRSRTADEDIIRRVVCIYDTKPWLNLDRMGDRDPEGISYRIFLKNATGKSTLREGTFHIEMYGITRDEDNKIKRTLVSDWHYPTEKFHTIAQPGMMGAGYLPHLFWSSKDLAGSEIEIITTFEDMEGRLCRSETKRLKIPRYKS